MSREITLKLDFSKDVIFEVPGGSDATAIAPPPPPPPAAASRVSDAQKQLHRLLEFVQWERVALKRFGLEPGGKADVIGAMARRVRLTATPLSPAVLRQGFREVLEAISASRRTLDDAIGDLDAVLAVAETRAEKTPKS